MNIIICELFEKVALLASFAIVFFLLRSITRPLLYLILPLFSESVDVIHAVWPFKWNFSLCECFHVAIPALRRSECFCRILTLGTSWDEIIKAQNRRLFVDRFPILAKIVAIAVKTPVIKCFRTILI